MILSTLRRMVRVNALRVTMGEVITDMMHLAKKTWNKRKSQSHSQKQDGRRNTEKSKQRARGENTAEGGVCVCVRERNKEKE